MYTIEEMRRKCSYCYKLPPFQSMKAFSEHWKVCPARVEAGYIPDPKTGRFRIPVDDKTKERLCTAIEQNDPQAVADLLHWHYRQLSKESLKGPTPDPDRAEYWRRVAARAAAIGKEKQ